MREEPPSASEPTVSGRSSAAWMVAVSSFSAYAGLVVANSTVSTAVSPRTASRAASTAIETESSS